MSEEEVNYVSVVFKANNPARPRVKKEEETMYDDVKAKTKGTFCPQGYKSNKKKGSGLCSCGCAACFLWTLCAVLLLVIIGISVHIFTLTREKELLEENQSYLQAVNQNLTLLNSGLNSANENLTRDKDDLTSALADSRRKNTELNSRIRKLNDDKAKLATEKRNLIRQLQNEPEHNISRAQWSVFDYCLNYPGHQCHACQRGWEKHYSSCYKAVYPSYNYPWKTWEQARQDCREKMADLVIIKYPDEKDKVRSLSWSSSGSNGYWIGLRVNNGTWEWADGSALRDNLWSQAPVAGHCAVSNESDEWTSVPCDSKNRWVCQKKGLIV